MGTPAIYEDVKMCKSIRSPMTRMLGTLVTTMVLVVPNLGAQQGGTVTGRVIDVSSSQPIAAVQVFIASLAVGGLTQQNGRYLLQNVPAGTHTLSVFRFGYPITRVQITVAGDRTVEQDFAISMESFGPPPRPRPSTWPYWFVPSPRSGGPPMMGRTKQYNRS